MRGFIIVDIDGTISNSKERAKHLADGVKDWAAFYAECEQDPPIQEVVDMVSILQSQGYKILFCTGREEIYREPTERWIKKVFPDYFVHEGVLMRKEKDYRHDIDVKPELLTDSKVAFADIAFILEDRSCMVRTWRDLGLKCFQVADGDF